MDHCKRALGNFFQNIPESPSKNIPVRPLQFVLSVVPVGGGGGGDVKHMKGWGFPSVILN